MSCSNTAFLLGFWQVHQNSPNNHNIDVKGPIMAIVTAAPMTNFLGIKDGSTRALPVETVPVPSHLAVVFGYAERGQKGMNFVSGSVAQTVYGDTVFDVRSKFATHQTVLANELNAVANPIMFYRVIPKDAAPAANVRISVEVVKTKINPKERYTDGSYKLDQNGATQDAATTVDGYLVKFVATHIDPDIDGSSKVGKGAKQTGTLVGANNEESTRYPLFDLEVSSQGAWGNLQGMRIWSADINSSIPVNDSLVKGEAKAYPYFFSFIKKASENATATPVYTDDGLQYVQLTLNPNAFDSNTDQDYYVGEELLNRFKNSALPTYIQDKSTFSTFKVYQSNIDELLELFSKAEKEALKTNGYDHDFDLNDNDDRYRFNLFGGYSTHGIPYTTYQIVKDTTVAGENIVRFSSNSNIMASGATDGTMTPEAFADLVEEAVEEITNPNSKYMDMARYPYCVLYDTGFPMKTKKKLGKFISTRKDTCLALVPSVFGQREPTADEESSICVALRTIMQAYPESEYFGTPVVRGMVFAHTGKLISSRWRHRTPLVIEAARKFARYMGATDGIWKTEYSPTVAPTNQVQMFTDISESYKPAVVRNRDWKAGMIWVDAFDLDSFYWPAIRTIYEDDTSVLTSAITMFGCCELEKIGERVRHEFSGRDNLTQAQFKERIETRYLELCANRFDDRFEITPTCDFTKGDVARGYSWTLKVEVRARNMKTVQTLYIEALRADADEKPTTNLNV